MGTVEVKLTSTLDIPTLTRRLNEAELLVMRKGGDRIVRKVKGKWVGWLYADAPKDKRGRSRAGWKRTLTSNTDPVTLTIENNAKDYDTGDPYVQHIHRAGSATLEYTEVFAEIVADDVPVLTAELKSAIASSLNVAGPPRRVRANKASDTVTETFK